MPERSMIVRNRYGIHARTARLIVEAIQKFACQLYITKDGETVDGNSILNILTLGATEGSELTFTSEGSQASALLDYLEDVLQDKIKT